MASLIETVARTRQVILLGIGFLILVMIGVTSVWLAQQSSRSSELLTEAMTAQNAISLFSLSLRRAESSQRGYVITGLPEMRDSYRADVAQTRERLVALHKSLSDGDVQRKALAAIAASLDRKIAEMDETIARYDRGEREVLYDFIRAGSGTHYMDDIRAQATTLSAEEAHLVQAHQTTAVENDYRLLSLSLAGSVLIVVIGALSVLLVQRSNRDRQRALTALEATNNNLERIVEFRTADLREANEEIQRFAYIVSHDLRSPLVNIMGFTSELETLRGDIFAQVAALREQLASLQAQAVEGTNADGHNLEQLGADFDEALGFIRTSIAKMDRLINAVLKLSREGRREFHPETIDMEDTLNSIVQTVTHRAIAQHATITLGDLPDVQSDRLAVEQIFSNLIDNALKYGRPGVPGTIEIAGRATPTHAVFEVRDNGRGIDATDYQRVFELFRRAGAQDQPGEGIGLAHVRALVRRLGGHMGLKSKLGEGSTFTVTLPRRWLAENRSAA